MTVQILHGDCLEAMLGMADASVDSVVTDPPYLLNFMGKSWDRVDSMPAAQSFHFRWSSEAWRLLKPGGHLVSFGGTRTYHRMACAIEDAGFEIRDQLSWIYGSGFPKSHNQPGGWGTALKPAHEPICLARKPLIGTVAANVAAHGTGSINVDGCRVEAEPRTVPVGSGDSGPGHGVLNVSHSHRVASTAARWPANVCHDGSDEALEAFARFGERRSSGAYNKASHNIGFSGGGGGAISPSFCDTGTAARFFFTAKASREEREIGHIAGERNGHPTVKPVDLMQWLCRLVTPPGGTVLDPFLGSGSTAIAADREGFSCIGIEREVEYVEIARRRISGDAPLLTELSACA